MEQVAPISAVREYQASLREELSRRFGDSEVAVEWRAMTDEPGVYSPRLDLAVGPFAVRGRLGDQYDAMVKKHSGLLRALVKSHTANLGAYSEAPEEFAFEEICHRNWNSRCFLAIEIENVVSRKHLMGGAINAAALGRVGIAVGWDDNKVRALVRLRSYLLFLARVGKNTFHPTNLLILSAAQLRDLLASKDSVPARKAHASS